MGDSRKEDEGPADNVAEFSSKQFWNRIIQTEAVNHVSLHLLDRLWGGTGDSCKLYRANITQDNEPSELHYIVKYVHGPSRRHANDTEKQLLKGTSYIVESEYLLEYAERFAGQSIHVPLVSHYLHKPDKQTTLLVMSDLKDSHPVHVAELSMSHATCAMQWLGKFHSFSWNVDVSSTTHKIPTEMHHKSIGWYQGGFWALDKRRGEHSDMDVVWKGVLREEFQHLIPYRSRSKSARRTRGKRRKQSREKTSIELLAKRLKLAAPSLQRWMTPHDKLENTTRNSKTDDDNLNVQDRKRPRVESENNVNNCTIIHGDFKAENLFFAQGNVSNGADCAVCDFQWVGVGLGAQDVFHVISTSLKTNLIPDRARITDVEWDLLRVYHKSLVANGVTNYSWDQLINDYDLSMLHFVRYVIGTGEVFPEDEWMLHRADKVLSEIDHGVVLESTYDYESGFRKKFMARSSSKSQFAFM